MKKPSEIIPKFIISLRGNQERVDYIDKEVLPKIQSGIVMSAVDYQQDNLDKKLSENNLKIATTFFDVGRVGQLACFLSHFEVWNLMVEKNIDVALVLEDDVKIYKNFNKVFDKIYDNLPVKFDYVHLFVHPEKQKLEYLDGKDGDIIPAEDNFGTVAYLISLRGARKLVKLTRLLKIQAPVDRFINFCIEHNFMKAFMVKKPFLITQGEILPNKSVYPNSYKSTIWYSPLLKDSKISSINLSPPGLNEDDLNNYENKTPGKKEEIVMVNEPVLNLNNQGPVIIDEEKSFEEQLKELDEENNEDEQEEQQENKQENQEEKQEDVQEENQEEKQENAQEENQEENQENVENLDEEDDNIIKNIVERLKDSEEENLVQ